MNDFASLDDSEKPAAGQTGRRLVAKLVAEGDAGDFDEFGAAPRAPNDSPVAMTR